MNESLLLFFSKIDICILDIYIYICKYIYIYIFFFAARPQRRKNPIVDYF